MKSLKAEKESSYTLRDVRKANNLSPTKCHKQPQIWMGTLVQPKQRATPTIIRDQIMGGGIDGIWSTCVWTRYERKNMVGKPQER
jgi:hypothetical protein